MWMKQANNFQIAKVQFQGVAQLLLNFCQFETGISYKSVAYKTEKNVIKNDTRNPRATSV